ncbi:hypothetical protein QCA50_015553 [Cerrena zonata]|uniref:Uncharacterized protein n=1 Tax=Cerrena zonata TaxID=2478898 RepID=A0AAW0FL41_9APHY
MVGTVTLLEVLRRLVVPSSGISICLRIKEDIPFDVDDTEGVVVVTDIASRLSRCDKGSTQLDGNDRVIYSVFIKIQNPCFKHLDFLTRYEAWGWNSILPRTMQPNTFSTTVGRTDFGDSLLYQLTWTTANINGNNNIDNISMLCRNFDLSRVHTLVLEMSPEHWTSPNTSLGVILKDSNNTVETIIAIDWDSAMLAAFLMTGDCVKTTVPVPTGDDTSAVRPIIPFPNLRSLSVYDLHGAIEDGIPKLPLTDALKYRAEYGLGIAYLRAENFSEDTREDVEKALGSYGRF